MAVVDQLTARAQPDDIDPATLGMRLEPEGGLTLIIQPPDDPWTDLDVANAPALAWEEIIRSMSEQIARAIAAGEHPAKLREMGRIKQFVMNSYALRFGSPYPDNP